MNLSSLANRLTQYDKQEARSIVRLLLNDCFDLTFTDICSGALDRLSPIEKERLELLMQSLENGEPVQYVTGKASFYGREFSVAPGVLIPRPETETLIDVVLQNLRQREVTHPSILDIGTGSGCIAITLAKELPESSITAWDISSDALAIAQSNAAKLGANVTLVHQDALNPPADTLLYDVIVSNPPYICQQEAESMEQNVLAHEPHLALFVPNDDPLLFYRAITLYAEKALRSNGLIAFEINPIYSKETQQLLANRSFHDVKTTKDEFGKERIVSAIKN